MDEKNFTPTFRVLIGIMEALRDCIDDINDEFASAIEEVRSVWKKIT
jgi:hypothetical protein